MARWSQEPASTKLSREVPRLETQIRLEIEDFRPDPWAFSWPFLRIQGHIKTSWSLLVLFGGGLPVGGHPEIRHRCSLIKYLLESSQTLFKPINTLLNHWEFSVGILAQGGFARQAGGQHFTIRRC